MQFLQELSDLGLLCFQKCFKASQWDKGLNTGIRAMLHDHSIGGLISKMHVNIRDTEVHVI